jgi:hypothetical protein
MSIFTPSNVPTAGSFDVIELVIFVQLVAVDGSRAWKIPVFSTPA